MADGHAGPGHQEHQRVTILAHVEVRTWRGPLGRAYGCLAGAGAELDQPTTSKKRH